MTYWGYESCPSCSGKPQPGTVALLKYLLERFPYTRSLGIYNCRNVGGTSTRSIHACGRALDLGIPTIAGRANTELGDPIVRFLDKYTTQFGLMGQIYNRTRYDAKTPRGRLYTGVNPHYDHDHIEQRSAQARSLRYADIVVIAGASKTEGDDMLGFTIGPKGAASVAGERSEALQLLLLDRGETLPKWGPDGSAGDETRAALASFQSKHSITDEAGYVGPKTYAALFAAGSVADTATRKYVRDHIATHAANPDAHHA